MATMSGWNWMCFDGAVSHMVANELHDVIVSDLESRGCPLWHDEEGTYLFIDEPGMISTLRPIEKIELDGLEVEIPSEDVGSMLAQLKGLPLRGGCYYKLHGFMRCLVMTQDQRDRLMETLSALHPAAEARAAEFWYGNKLPSEVLREANAVANGVPIEDVPDCGGHKLDRFMMPPSGSMNN